MAYKISLIHPSRQRPDIAIATAIKWLNSLSDKGSVEYILSVDSSDPTLKDYERLFKDERILVNDNKSAIEAINYAATIATGNIIVVMSDDFDCPDKWDELLLTALEGKEDFVVKTSDGCQPWIITLPILDRKYYDRYGYVYNPEFLHLFSDTEMTHVGHLLGRVINLPIVFSHHHYTQVHGHKFDDVNAKNDKTWAQGEAVYLKNLKENFGIANPLPIELPFHHADWLNLKGIFS